MSVTPASPPVLRTQDLRTGRYTVQPHKAERYPPGHADTTSCIRCGHSLDDQLHTVSPVPPRTKGATCKVCHRETHTPDQVQACLRSMQQEFVNIVQASDAYEHYKEGLRAVMDH